MSDASRCALLVADLQWGTLASRIADSGPLLNAAARALDAARSAGVTVIHVRVAFRPGHPEVSPRNRAFAPLLETDFMIEGSAEAAIHDEVTPLDSEVVVTKHRVGAFGGTDLERVLRAKNVEHLILAGYATSGVILTTVRDAADRDYELTVLSDAIADDDPELHDMLIGKVIPRQATVIDTAAFAAGSR